MIPSNKRVLMCRSNPVAPEPRAEKEARALVEAGYTVKILAWDRAAIHPKNEHKGGYDIERIPIKAQYGSGLRNIFSLLKWQFALFSGIRKIHSEFDIIHACDFDTIIPAYLAKKLWGKKIVYDIYDFYADHVRAPAFFTKPIRALDLKLIDRVDGVIIADESRREQINGSHPRELIVIYNTPEEISPTLETPGKPNQSNLSITFVGALQIERGLLQLCRVVRNHPEWHLDLAGYGGDEEKILQEVENAPNITWHGKVSYETALDLNRQADVLIATYDPSIRNHKYTSPNKVFEAMMLSKPIIVAKNTNIDKVITKWSCGLVVEYGNETALADAFASLAENPGKKQSLGKNGRKAYEQGFSWSIMRTRLVSFYDRISKRIDTPGDV